jgi:type IV secretory pathway VirB4 component
MKKSSSCSQELNEALCKKKLFIDAFQKRPESISEFFTYDEYIPEHRIYRNKDESFGVVYKIKLVEHESQTSREIVENVKKLKSWFNFSENCTLQIAYEQTPLSPRDEVFQNLGGAYPNAHPVAEKLYQERLLNVKESCNKETGEMPMVRSLYVSVKYFPDHKRGKDLWSVLRRPESTLNHVAKNSIREIRNFLHIIEDFESSCHLEVKRLNADELLGYLRKIFNPESVYKRDFAKFNPNISLSEQIVYNSPTLSYEGIEREGVKTRTISLKTSPEYAYPGGMAYFCKLKFPFRLTLSVSFPSKEKVKKFFDIKEFFLQNSPSAKSRLQQVEILEIQDRLARDDKCVFVTFNVTIEGKSNDELDKRTREVVNVFHNNLEAEAISEEDIGLGLFLNSLPMGHGPEVDLSAQRYVRMLRSDIVNFIPIFDSFRGMEGGEQLFLSRENNLLPFSLLNNETSNHSVLMADSGSGKSAFVINAIQGIKRIAEEPIIYILDKKSSYPMVAEYFDGELDVFGESDELSFSVFKGVFDESKVSFLTNFFMAGIRLTSPTYELESEHLDAISTALKLAYKKKCEKNGLKYIEGELKKVPSDSDIEINMEDLVTELGQLGSLKEFESFAHKIDELTHRLKPFYGNGTYAKYFSGTTKKRNPNCRFFVYDLDSLDKEPTLQTLMSLAIMEEIRRVKKLPENKARDVFVIIEEMGRLGNIPEIANMVTDFAETGRKLRMWLIAIAPRAKHFFETEVGKAMVSVADNFLFMCMNAQDVDYLKEKFSLIDEANSEIIRSLQTKKDQYAEFFYMNKKKTIQGAGKYVQTAKEKWLAPTNARDALKAAEALERFDDKWDALDFLCQRLEN